MTTLEIIFGVGNIVLPALAYFAGVQRTNLLHKQDDSNERINRVVDLYVKSSQSGRNNGPDGLVKAGIYNLRDEKEVREACSRIVAHGEIHPCLGLREKLESISLFLFFKKAKEVNLDFRSGQSYENMLKILKM